jgi:hypothetical protein
MHNSTMILLAATPLMAWKMYSRTRRLIGRQKLTPARPWIQLVIFTLLLGLFTWANLTHPLNLALLLGGVLFGLALAIHGLRLTEYEVTDDGLFYTPHTWIGIGLSVAFFAVVVYRLVLFGLTETTPSPSTMGRSPALVAVFATFAGYYLTYAIGMLRWRASVSRVDADASTHEAS